MKKLATIMIFSFTVNLTAQNTDLLPTSTTGEIVKHKYYTLSYSEKNEQSEWVFYLLTKTNSIGAAERGNNFRPDPSVTTGSASLLDYRNSGYDKGHLCPAADMSFNAQAMSETFYLSNMSPQVPSFNRGIWKSLEELVRRWAIQEDSIYIITGPIFTKNKGTIGSDKVTVPGYFYKVIYDPTGVKKMIAFILPNVKATDKQVSNYSVPVDSVEKVTKIDFFHNLPDDVESRLEKGFDLKLWKF